MVASSIVVPSEPPREPGARLEEALTRRLGLRADVTGKALQRLLASDRSDLARGGPALASLVRTIESGSLDDASFAEIVSAVTVPESYFYRDRAQITWLRDTWVPELIADRRASGTRKVRVWSAGCCAGQEPYTIAILLAEALEREHDLDDWDIRILGTDISDESLQIARSGVYNEGSIRSEAPAGWERWFTPGPLKTYRLDPAIVAMAEFARLNLASDRHTSVVRDYGALDLVLCRNVLMYLTPDHVREVVFSLVSSLGPGGVLLLGPSDFHAARIARRLGLEQVRGRAYQRPRGAWRPDVDRLPSETARPPARTRSEAPRRSAPRTASRTAPRTAPPPPVSAPEGWSDAVPTDAAVLAAELATASHSTVLSMLATAALDQRDLIAELLAAEDWAAATALIHLTFTYLGRDPWLFVQKARALMGVGDFEGALDHADSAVVLDAHEAEAHFLAGVALLALAEPGEAQESLACAVELDPRHAAARVALALLREGKPSSWRDALTLHHRTRSWARRR